MEFKDFHKTKFQNYYVNTDGLIYDNLNNKIVVQKLSRKGYLRASIKINGKWVTYISHRLIAETFIPNPENKPQVNHINGIKTDNRVENLEWTTCLENIRHAIETGLFDNRNAHKSLRKKIVDTKTNVIYNSITEASKAVGLKMSTLSAMLTNQNPNKTSLKFLDNE